MSITEVKMRTIRVLFNEGSSCSFTAAVRDGQVTDLDTLDKYGKGYNNVNRITAYIQFLQEVLEAIKQTEN